MANELEGAKNQVSLEFRDLLGGAEDDFDEADIDDDNQEHADAFTKFTEDAQLAGVAGGWQHVERLAKETAALDADVADKYRRIAEKAETPQAGDPQALAKRFSGPSIQKSENGRWEYQFDSRGELVSGREVA